HPTLSTVPAEAQLIPRFGARCAIHASRSPSSVQFGKGVTSAQPGSAQGLCLVVADIESARADLVKRGVTVSDIFHRAGPGQPALPGRDPQGRSYVSFATFSDPDGNMWLLQEVNQRLPGRIESA